MLEEEIALAFEEEIAKLEGKSDDDGWFCLPSDMSLRVVSRAACRVMNGREFGESHKLCRFYA